MHSGSKRKIKKIYYDICDNNPTVPCIGKKKDSKHIVILYKWFPVIPGCM